MTSAAQLLKEAARAEWPADLCPPPGRATVERALLLAELFAHDLSSAPPRALWNLLSAAATLSRRVDVYTAARLWSAVERLFIEQLSQRVRERGELADAVEMTFDFFFGDGGQPLEGLRMDEVSATLERILALDNPFCRRAALHGLSHLIARHEPPTRTRLQAVIDRFLQQATEPAMIAYAEAARDGLLA
jgi:hypothetical protein